MWRSTAASWKDRIRAEEAIARTESMQSLYEKLLLSGEYREISMKTYLEDLVNSILEIFTFHCAVTLEMNISDVPLDIKRAGTIGIIDYQNKPGKNKGSDSSCDKG